MRENVDNRRLIEYLLEKYNEKITEYENYNMSPKIPPNLEIKTITKKPPKEKTIEIYQRGFGFRKPEDDLYLSTNLGYSNIGLYIKFKDGFQILASLDVGTYENSGYYKQTSLIFNYLESNGLKNEDIDEIICIKPEKSFDKGVYEIYSFLRNKGLEEKTKLTEGGSLMNIIVSGEGIYLLDSISNIKKVGEFFIVERLSLPGLIVENTGEIIGSNSKIYPKVYNKKTIKYIYSPIGFDIFFCDNKYCIYSRSITLDNIDLYFTREFLKELNKDGLKISISKNKKLTIYYDCPSHEHKKVLKKIRDFMEDVLYYLT